MNQSNLPREEEKGGLSEEKNRAAIGNPEAGNPLQPVPNSEDKNTVTDDVAEKEANREPITQRKRGD